MPRRWPMITTNSCTTPVRTFFSYQYLLNYIFLISLEMYSLRTQIRFFSQHDPTEIFSAPNLAQAKDEIWRWDDTGHKLCCEPVLYRDISQANVRSRKSVHGSRKQKIYSLTWGSPSSQQALWLHPARSCLDPKKRYRRRPWSN